MTSTLFVQLEHDAVVLYFSFLRIQRGLRRNGFLFSPPACRKEIGRVRAIVLHGVVAIAIAIIDGGLDASAIGILAGEGDFVLVGVGQSLDIPIAFDAFAFIGRRGTH